MSKDLTLLIDQIRAITSVQDMELVSAIIQAMPGKMAPEVQQALVDKLKEVNQQSKQARVQAISILRQNGVDYPLTDWLTPKNYAKKFGIDNPETVLNWIRRGVIPAQNVKEIPELDLRLVKAVVYTPRPYAKWNSFI